MALAASGRVMVSWFMNDPSVLLLAVAIGIVAGLRSLTAPAAVSWAAHF